MEISTSSFHQRASPPDLPIGSISKVGKPYPQGQENQKKTQSYSQQKEREHDLSGDKRPRVSGSHELFCKLEAKEQNDGTHQEIGGKRAINSSLQGKGNEHRLDQLASPIFSENHKDKRQRSRKNCGINLGENPNAELKSQPTTFGYWIKMKSGTLEI
ncbi:hypothetical protein V6N13_064358 [Hibiscus sabdariffa]